MAGTPLPPVKDDPNIHQGMAAEVAYTQAIAAIRADRMLSDLARAEKIDAAWTTLAKTRADLSRRFHDQRRARLESLEAEIPVGPNIASDMNRADAVVLHQAFNAALTTARNADRAGLELIWTDAQRFDDDNMRRAVLTTALDRGMHQFVDAWAAGDPKREAGLKEIGPLRAVLMSAGPDRGFIAKAFGGFGLPRQPVESVQLPMIRERAEVRT